MIPPLTTTLDDRLASIQRFRPRPFSDGGGMGPDPDGGWVSWLDLQELVAAQPPPPTEALRLLRALLASHDALEDGLASFDLHNDAVTNLESVTIEARRYLAATEEGTP